MPRRAAKQVPIDRLRELFELRGGELFYRVNQRRARAGELAGYARPDGYWYVCVDYVKLLRHRVVFAMVTGRWPSDIDHVNGTPGDDRPENLRECSHNENMQNGRKRKNNTSGAPGVYWDKEKGKWAVAVRCRGKTYHFGRHHDFELAELIAQEARRRLFGAFAPSH